MEISFEDNKVDESLTSKCVYEGVKNAVQEFHGHYGRACLARSLKGSSICFILGAFHFLCTSHLTPLPKNFSVHKGTETLPEKLSGGFSSYAH